MRTSLPKRYITESQQSDGTQAEYQQWHEVIWKYPTDQYGSVRLDQVYHRIETVQRPIGHRNRTRVIKNWRQIKPEIQEYTKEVLCVPKRDMESSHEIGEAEGQE